MTTNTQVRPGGLFPSDPRQFHEMWLRHEYAPKAEEPFKEPPKTDDFYWGACERIERQNLQTLRLGLQQNLTEVLHEHLRRETEKVECSDSEQAAHKVRFDEFRRWAMSEHLPCLPTVPEVVAYWLLNAGAAGPRVETAQQILDSIAFYHRWNDTPLDTNDLYLKATLSFIAQCEEQEKLKSGAKAEKPRRANGKSH
jgi:hypothetical protein